MDEDKVIGHIYILLFPSGKRYVGQTIQTIEERMKGHWHPPKKEKGLPVHNAMRVYGKEGTMIEKVFTIECTQGYLDVIEQRAIKHYNTLSPHGYNLTEGGYGGAKSEEHKAKISAAMKGRPGTMTGKHHSEETKAKISAIRTGKHRSEETKAKVSAARIGKCLSEEIKAKMSASKMGHPGYWKGRSGPWTGKHRSEETKAKISESLKRRA